MFGFSIFLDNMYDLEVKVKKRKDEGFTHVFTSGQPGEYEFDVMERLSELLNLCNKYGLSLVCDVSGNDLEKYDELIDNKLILRLDYGADFEKIIKYSKRTTIHLNASTLREKDLKKMIARGVNFHNIIACHNYYPKEYTGLSREYFTSQNNMFKKYRLKIAAFVSGDGNLRAPEFRGLPSVEDLREKSAFVSAVELIEDYAVDFVYITDDFIRDMHLFKDYKNGVLTLPITIWDHENEYLLKSKFKNRKDHAQYVIRVNDSKKINWNLHPNNTIDRVRGSITLENERNNRYKGELEVCLDNLPKSQSTNVLGRVEEHYIDLIDRLVDEREFKFFIRK